MEKMKMHSADITKSNIDKIAEWFPNCITETADENGKLKKAINFETLHQMLSEDVAEGDEAYEFTWVGKKAAIVEANKPIRKTLRPCKEESVDWDTTENLYIEGDNLKVLKLLQESYLGKVKMIYIDPPYNTGSDRFIYTDDFHITKEEYKEMAGYYDEEKHLLFRENTESNPQFHSVWCSMIYSRLMLARNLLSDEGVIFISIDDNEMENLSKICSEIYGEDNFVCKFIWKSKLGKVGTTSTISSVHEYILCYAKKLSSVHFKMIKNISEGRKESLRQWGVADRREDRPSMFYPITINGIEVYPIKEDGTEGRWRVGEDMAKQLLEEGVLELGEKNGKYNIYRNFPSGISFTPYSTLLLDEIGTTAKGATMLKSLNLGKVFDFSKPVELIKHFAFLCTDSNDIVVDFFSGSATTAQAVMQLNAEDGGHRKFIMVQLDEKTDEKSEAYKSGYKNICEIGKERIRRAGAKIKESLEKDGMDIRHINKELQKGEQMILPTGEIVPKISARWGAGDETEDNKKIADSLDIGFRVLKVDESNMTDVYYSPLEINQQMLLEQVENIKPDRTDLDLLFGCLTDWGIPLNLPYVSENIDGCNVHTYNDGDLIACFDKNVPESVIREIAKRQPLRAVFRDSSFADSPAKINVEEIFKMIAPDTRVRVI